MPRGFLSTSWVTIAFEPVQTAVGTVTSASLDMNFFATQLGNIRAVMTVGLMVGFTAGFLVMDESPDDMNWTGTDVSCRADTDASDQIAAISFHVRQLLPDTRYIRFRYGPASGVGTMVVTLHVDGHANGGQNVEAMSVLNDYGPLIGSDVILDGPKRGGGLTIAPGGL